MKSWLVGWYETIRLYLFEHETYKFLRDYEIDPDDFSEVVPWEDVKARLDLDDN